MLATKDVAELLTTAQRAGAKVILAGDDKQLASIARGGLFTTLRERHGAAELHEVVRVRDDDQKRAFRQMHEGDFRGALGTFEAQGRIRWGETQDDARKALVAQWAADTAERPETVRFVFAYTNAEVIALNGDLRAIRRDRGELGEDHRLATKDGPADFATGDRVQFTGSAFKRSAKGAGLANGNVGTVREIEGNRMTVALDGSKDGPARLVSFEVGENARAGEFNAIRHGYAGTIYKGQGRTVDEAYSLHSQYWRSASSYVATTRHRDNVTIFTARELAEDVDALARQMSRTDENRAASQFHRAEIVRDAGRDFGRAAQEAAGRPQTAEPTGPALDTDQRENPGPTPAELAEAQRKAAKVAASRDPAAALHRQHKRDAGDDRAADQSKTPALPSADQGADDRSRRADELRAIKESLARDDADRPDPGQHKRRDRGRTR
jgi:ATP-dependent exoDNAse (exonuclease V) alpha subunit